MALYNALMRSLYSLLQNILEAEHDRHILWLPVWVAGGITWYFSLKYEPYTYSGTILLCLTLLPLFLLRRRKTAVFLLGAMALVAFGFTLAQMRAHTIDSAILSTPLSFVHISGKIIEINPKPKGSKLVLSEVIIDKLPKAQTPKHISVTLRKYDPDLVTGQMVSLRAGLFPPPEPAIPGGFDFNRYFYFREIGAVGYGIPPLEAKSLENSGNSSFAIWVAEFRHRLTENIRSHFNEPAGSIAAAFITGETNTIPDSINDNMRIAGLYHLLAVSGMNLSIVAGLAFFSLRFVLATIPAISLRYNIKKYAALLALIVSYIYLRVSGSPVSAERAFFMVSLVFVAILLDRDPMPMRSVAIAALCIMLYEPEAVLTASFQLSFSATAALIASYEWGVNWLARHSRQQGFGITKILFYFAAVMATSLVAWLATEPFIIYHFNQFSSFSLFANTIAEPLVSFLLMPLVIAGVLLMPFGLGGLAFTPMQYGIDFLLLIANYTAKLPHAMWLVPNPTNAGFCVAVLGGIWIYFWKTAWRWLGIFLVTGGMLTMLMYVPPDIFVSGDGKRVAVRLENGSMALLKGSEKNITAQSWAHAALEHDYMEEDDIPQHCDDKGCILHLYGRSIALLDDAAALNDDCHSSDILIIPSTAATPDCMAAVVIDKIALEKNGGAVVYMQSKDLVVKHTRSEQGDRLWVSGSLKIPRDDNTGTSSDPGNNSAPQHIHHSQ